MKRCVALLAMLVACTHASVIGYVAPEEPDAAPTRDAGTDATRDALADAGAVLVIDECVPGVNSAVPLATVEALRAVTSTGGRWLYPYDETVMPRGVGAPALMWEDFDAKAVLVRVRGRGLDYEACTFVASRTAQLSDAGWLQIEQHSGGSDDPLSITVAMVDDQGSARLLPARTLVIASEPLRGSLFYMAYASRLAPTTASGAVFQMELGATSRPVVAPLSCAGCHAISASGNRLLAYSNGLGAGFALTSRGNTQISSAQPSAELSALSPDGTVYVSPARALGAGPRFYGPINAQVATLYETDTGVALPNAGIAPRATMPAFAPEGTALVFTDFALSNGKGIAMMRFDPGARRADGYRALFTDDARFPGWPTFLPGRAGVVFALGERSDYSGNGVMLIPGTSGGPRSDLYALPLAEGATPVMLHRAMGFASAEDAEAERSDLPFGAAELHQNYNPQVASIAAGGYAWVFFDSIRHYGHRGLRRQIWCAAIDADHPERSHPAFYVRGQDADVPTFRPVFARTVP